MKNFFNRVVSIILITASIGTLIPACPVQAALPAENVSMDEALLFMLTANARLVSDTNNFPDGSFSFNAAHNAGLIPQLTRKQVNEQRLLAHYYLDLAKKFPTDSTQAKTFFARGYAHNEMADLLQRRRDRAIHPFQQIGRAITRPFKFIAREIVKLVRQGIKMLEEVGPEIIYDMIESYVTTGTPINAKIFFHKFKDIAMERMKNSLTNKAVAMIMGVLPKPTVEKPRITVTVSKLMQTMTARALPVKETDSVETESVETAMATEEGSRKYGEQTVAIGAEDVSNWAIVSKRYFVPIIGSRTECGYIDFETYELEKIVMPIQIDLNKGVFTTQITGTGSDYLETTEITIPAWELTSKFSGEISDGTIVPKEDKTGWILEGTMQMKVTPGGQKRCMHYPLGYPDVPAEYIWFKPERALIIEQAFHGEINQQKGVNKDKVPIITPGGKLTFDIGLAEAEGDTGDYFVMQVVNAEIPSAFPPP